MNGMHTPSGAARVATNEATGLSFLGSVLCFFATALLDCVALRVRVALSRLRCLWLSLTRTAHSAGCKCRADVYGLITDA